MPGSWIKAGRQLVGELRETLRHHRRDIRCEALPFAVNAATVYYDLPIPSAVFGGQLAVQKAIVHDASARITACVSPLETILKAHLGDAPGLVIPPPITCVPPITAGEHGAVKSSLLARQADLVQFPVPIVPPAQIVSIEAAQWRLAVKPTTQSLKPGSFQKVRVSQASAMPKTTARRMPLAQAAIALERKPIPPHRFPREKRERFRTALAQAVGLPENEIQIVGVYDRVYLSLFQSVSQGQDGTLVCKPKLPTEIDRRAMEMPPVYLVIGRADRQPNKTFRAVLPMETGDA